MITVSDKFKTAMKQPIKEIQAFIDYADGSIKDSDDLISFKISCDSGLCKSAMRKLEAKYLGSHNLLGKWVRVGYGVRLPDGEFEYLNYGSFLVTELTVTKDTDTTNIVGYDKAINTMTNYMPLETEYPIRLLDYTKLLCGACNLELGSNLLGNNATINTVSGSNIVDVTEALNTKPISIAIDGNSYQEGEPTVETPAEITTITDEVEIKVTGKNILKPTLTVGTTEIYSHGDITLNDDLYTLTCTIEGDMYFGEVSSVDKIYPESNGVLIDVSNCSEISFSISNELIDKNYITCYDENKMSLGYTKYTTSSGVYTIPDNAKYISFRFGVSAPVLEQTYEFTVQVEKGETITEYEKYKENTISVDLQDTELCAVGDVKDTLAIQDGKIILTNNIGKVILDGTQSIYSVDTTQTNTTRVLFTDILDFNALGDKNFISSHLTYTSMWNRDIEGLYTDNGKRNIIIRINKTTIGTTEDEINAFLSSNPITVYYVLAEPQVVELGEITINDLLNGINHISVYSNLAPSNTTVSYYQGTGTYNIMNDWQITQELWANIEGITYRDIFVQIAQATASTCIIGVDDKVYFKPLTDTGESLTYDNMFKLKLEALYGEINSVVLSRTPSEDNIFLQDESSVQTNGLTEFKIENNEIIDKDRENAITPIFEVLNGVSYYPFESTTEGLGWYEIADNITIVNDLGEEFKTSLFNYSVTIDGSLKETLKTTAETKTQTQYQYATTISKRVKNTEVIVNKQDQYIKQLVSDMYEENGVVNEKYTSIYQDIENIVNSVQTSGGNNLIKNSVMFAYNNNGIITNWDISGDGDISIGSNIESLSAGGLSGHSFTLLEKMASQTVSVSTNTHYTFSTRIKKDATGSCYVRLYNSTENHIISVAEGESAYYKEYELKSLLPTDNYYIVEFYGTADSNATFTDNMLAVGEYKSQWTQANGEIMNTQVNINIDGITVKSSIYLGDYTVISPLEFAGYSIINGTPTKVFSLNKDVTEIKKLLATDEVTMPPIKIVPITEGDLQGWAFVPYTQEV